MSELKEIGIRWEENGELHFSHVYDKYKADKVIAHHKYKRCLAMAKWCHNQREIYERDSYNWELENAAVDSLRNKTNIMRKWRNRWLKLAEEPTWAKFLQLIHKEEK